jgi:tetratricopeptide (TPR) repeat protein
MEKIQNAAALQNQAELLARSTTDTQRLQIANDTARLNIKKSMSDLEDAIAAKDEAAITAATKRLNEDVKIFNALSGQNVKLQDIKSILEGLKPKDLIDLGNLDAALAKIREMLNLLSKANTESKAQIPTSGSLGSGIPTGDFIAPISTAGGSIGAILEYADAASARANAFADLLDMQNAQDLRDLIAYQSSVGDMGGYSPYMNRGGSGGGSGGTNITVNTGVGDPEAIARAVEDVIRQSYQRGTSSTGLLAV